MPALDQTGADRSHEEPGAQPSPTAPASPPAPPERPALDRLVDYSRRLPRSGQRFDQAWGTLHSDAHPVLVRRAVDQAERAVESGLKRLPRLAPPTPATLVERETEIDGVRVFYRASATPSTGPVIVHVHGFGISGTYLLPTAGELAEEYQTYVPDLPGYGRSGNPPHTLSIPELADSLAAFMDVVGVERATLVGNSMGSAITAAFAAQHRDRIERAVLVSPAGGLHNRPLGRALAQMVQDVPREPVRLAAVAAPDYLRFGLIDSLRLFRAMTQFPALERLLALDVPAMAVLGERDPLMPPTSRVREVATAMHRDVTLVRLRGVAHAANFSHPAVLAHVIRQFLADRPITQLPGGPDVVQVATSARAERRANDDPQT
jgi:pimeloyl-ACP methyl ester carboxylesterase